MTDSDDEEYRQRKGGRKDSLRDNIRMPARFREDGSPDSVSTHQGSFNKRRRVTATPESGAELIAPGNRGRRKKDDYKAPSIYDPGPGIAYPPAAFPSLDTGVNPPSAREKRMTGILQWVAKDIEHGRWGDSWGDVGAEAPLAHIKMALEGRAKRAFARGQQRTASWYRYELDHLKRIPIDDDTPRVIAIWKALRQYWPVIAVEVFGEEPSALRRHVNEIDQLVAEKLGVRPDVEDEEGD